MLGERGLWLKKTFFEPSLRVPMIISAPHRMTAGRVTTPASLVDLLPTFMALATEAGWSEAVEDLDGTDLCALTAQPEDPDRPVYAELLSEGILAPIFMIRRGRFKLVTSKGDPDMLFDLETDPDERHNLAGHQTMPTCWPVFGPKRMPNGTVTRCQMRSDSASAAVI